MKLWQPSEQQINDANVTSFIKKIEQAELKQFADYSDFYHWTVSFPEKFWAYLADFCQLKFSKKYRSVIENPQSMPGAKWFQGASFNFAENLLRYSDNQDAIIFWNEKGRQSVVTYAQLRKRAAGFQKALYNLGISSGDRVAACLPNIPEAVIAMLGSTASGAVWSSCSPDFSAQAMIERFSQINPKVLITCDGYCYKGQRISILPQIKILAENLPNLKAVVIVPYLNSDLETLDIPFVKSATDFLVDDYSGELNCEQLPSDHPLYILYSSGTTGKPKCIVHSAIGILLQHSKELCLEADLKREDKIFYNTTCGWMMWNWLVSSLGQGATILLYDGFTLANEGNILFEMAEKEQVTIFGTSAGYLQKIEEIGLNPKAGRELKKLRAIFSTGSRLKPESFDYVYKQFGNLRLSPIWGGTDLCGCLGGSSPVLPVFRDQIQTRGLGLAVDVVDQNGKSIIGEVGEVVVRKAFPSMPLGFLNDANNKNYKASYFEYLPGMWHHGDLAILTENGGLTLLGRSDDTLNPSGIRIGASEVTSAAEQVAEVCEAMAVAQKWKEDERIVLFVILQPQVVLNDKLKKLIIEKMPSPRHRPKKIIEVKEFPITINGKRSVRAVRDIINNNEVKNLLSLSNPDSLKEFHAIKELQED